MTETTRPYDARAVANFILGYAKERGLPLTVMQLLKLVYLAHGWSLALLGRPLVKQNVQAWQYGPVYPHIYKALNSCGSAPISGLIADKTTGLNFQAEFDEDEIAVITSVVKNYGRMHAYQLSDIMHRPGTPWTSTYHSVGPYKDIPNDLIQKHFQSLKANRDGQGQGIPNNTAAEEIGA